MYITISKRRPWKSVDALFVVPSIAVLRDVVRPKSLVRYRWTLAISFTIFTLMIMIKRLPTSGRHQRRMVLYVAGPYRGVHPTSVRRNIQSAKNVAVDLWVRGYTALCPHLNTENFEECAPELTFDDYIDGDFAMLKWCDGIVMAPSWAGSVGALMEKTYAELMGIPVFYYPDVPEAE